MDDKHKEHLKVLVDYAHHSHVNRQRPMTEEEKNALRALKAWYDNQGSASTY
jgi:hypothetical protein